MTSLLALALALAVVATGAPLELLSQERVNTGALVGIVVAEDDVPLGEVAVRLARTDGTEAYAVTSDAEGRFRVASVVPGLYRITARRIGYREAEHPLLRIVSGQTSQVRVTMARSATQLSTVRVIASPTDIDATSAEMTRQIAVEDVKLIPMGRDAASLVELVPGARKGFVWGAGGDAANNYQLDGVGVNHPGLGGDYLTPSIDWIESLVVRGLGAGAEYGGFQGGIINAVTKSGSNNFQGALRFNYIAPGLTSSNVRANEEGAEQTMRREVSGELRGPLLRDRIFYFITGQAINRDVRIPNLVTPQDGDFRAEQQQFTDARGLAKLSFLPALGVRLDALYGRTDIGVERAELNGINDPSAARRYTAPTSFYSLAFTRASARSSFDARIAGFNATESRLGYAGDDVPGIQVFRIGRQPGYQNSVFNDRLDPRSLGGNITWKTRQSLPAGGNELVIGAEYTRGWWKQQRTRNGGLTWRPYSGGSVNFDPSNPASWSELASEWGGEIHLESDVEDAAFFVQDYLTLLPGLTFTPGLRYGRWTGNLTPSDTTRFQAARHQAFDPRLGVVWDITGRNEFVFKAHWGRYHQGMSSFFFDRAEGANAYSNQRFYYQGPTISDPTQVFTVAQREAMRDPNTGFGTLVESIMNESGRVENYRQPYVEQAIIGFEKTFGPRWKAEALYTNRINRDIAGLVDRNLANNYSPLTGVYVKHRITFTPVADQNGHELVLPVVWVRNDDLRRELQRRCGATCPNTPVARQVPGYVWADIGRLSYNPDIALTTIPQARRRLDQVSFSLRTEQSRWNGFWSFTYSNLVGNVGGLTGFADVTSFASGFGTAVPSFTAGPHVRPNEATNFEGRLPTFSRFESKLWLGARLPLGFQGGTFTTFSSGEYITPVAEITPRFRFQASDLSLLVDGTFDGVMGQTVLLEPRGYRKYPARTNVDLRLERSFAIGPAEWAITADVFNVFGSDAVIANNLTINDQVSDDPTSQFGAPRLRVAGRAARLGSRVTF
ncbi:MAG TPA: carboxypeptidase regulatory-like domain-containing protein [Gemmatimonadaceae bacterium]|nr:carboxypeptidase regulatory-like domain-containing protein [Gemmatimonadaceae bacterium]